MVLILMQSSYRRGSNDAPNWVNVGSRKGKHTPTLPFDNKINHRTPYLHPKP